MKLSWNGLFSVQAPLMSPPDAGAGGGDAGGDGDAGAGDGAAGDGDAGGDAGDGDGAARQAAGDEEEDPDDDGLAPEIANDPKRLRTRLRRTQRQLKPFRDVEGALRDPASGRLLTPQEITRRFSLADDQAELNAFFAEHPDMLEQILERKRGGGRREAAAKPTFVDPFADPSKLPFDATDEAGRFFVDNMRAQAKENFELRELLNEIREGQQGLQQGVQRERLSRVEETWKTNTLGAAKAAGLDAEDTKDFVNNVYRDFRLLGAEKKLDKADVNAVIARNIRPFSRHAAGRSRGAAATQQRMADGNSRRPQPQRQGAPTTAQAKTNSKETIKDGRRTFFERAGQRPPAH